MQQVLVFLCLTLSYSAFSQINEDFSDGDITSNPTWTGDIALFEIETDADNLTLHSNGPSASDALHLSTTNSELNNTTWQILVDMRFSPSSSNKIQVYLVSDQSNLEESLNGYYIEIGQSGSDEIKLIRQDGNTKNTLFTGTSQLSGNVLVNLRVTRDGLANWSVFADITGGETFQSEGPSFMDDTHLTTSYFGLVCHHTSTRNDLFYFDDISIQTEEAPFSTASVVVESANSLNLTFNQSLDQSSAETLSNYSLSAGYGNPISAELIPDHSDQVLLVFSDDFVNNHYTLAINEVENENQDETISDQTHYFEHEEATPFRALVINEIYADYNPSAIGLPDEEFIELYNNSDQNINIADFQFNGEAIQDFELEIGEYVIITDDSNLAEYESFGEVVSIISFPTLTNGGMQLLLTDNLGNLVDSVSYSDEWYLDENKEDGGFSLEQINPELTCNYSANWTASNHTNGGTPGSQNSTYDISPDVQGPNILNLEVINPTSIQLTFDEPMDELSLINAEYTMEPEIGINSVTTTNWQTTLHLIDPLVSGNEYTITVNGVTDCSGNEMISNSISIYYDIEAPVLENIEVANEHEILVKFNEALEVSSATFLPNYEVIHFGNPVSINLQEEDSSVMLSFDQVFISGQEYQLQITGVQDLTENVLDTTELTFIYHPPFSTASVVVESTNSLNLTFNQHLDRSSAETLSNYSLSAGYGNPISAELIPDHSDQVLLVFSDDFVNNQYTLTINEVENENQDETISDQTIYFEHEVATPFRALVINEIYADYNPSAVGLPDEEFVELYNNSNQNINIADFQLNGEAIQDFELASGAYVILTDNSNLGEYESFGEVVSIISFPTLTNGGMQLLLTDNLGNLVDSISYSDEWYLDENKEDGGFSLEQINPELTCNHSANWTASNDAKGGTPGSQNSTYDISPDVKGPNILNLEVINPTSIQLTFDEPMNESSLINAGYTIDPEIGINSVTTTNWQVTFVLADPLVSSKEYTITVNGVTDCTGNNLVDNVISTYYDIEAPVLENIHVANEREILVKFNEALEVSSATFLPNYEIIDFGNPTSINLQEEDSSVMLSFVQAFISGQEYQLQITGVQDLTENVLDTTELTFIYHPPFKTASVVVESANNLNLTFNQPLDRSSAETLSNYSLSAGYGNPISVELIPEHSDQVILVFSDDFVNNHYTLTINEVENQNQEETISHQTLYFEHEVATPFRALAINEIYADHNPSAIGLPDEEFIELYNNSNQNINIADFQFNGEAIQDFELEIGEYVIITDDSNLAEYESFGEVVSIISFPTLTNGGMQLLLTDNLGNLVDSISYSDEWYLDENKEGGGYSLEQINPELTCNYSANWAASNDTNGGTPGTQNSIFDGSPDILGPSILIIEIINSTSIKLTFDEPMDEASLSTAVYTIDPEIGINSVTTTNWQVTFVLADPLVSSNEYTITVNGATDCTGNNLVENVISTYYDIEAPILDNIHVKNASQLTLFFDEALTQSNANQESNYFINSGIGHPQHATIGEENPTSVTLRFNSDLTEELNYTLSLSNLSDLSGNIMTEKLESSLLFHNSIDTVHVQGANQLQILFKDEVTRTSVTNPNNYHISDEIGYPVSAILHEENDQLIELLFKNEFDNNKQLTLAISNITDVNSQLLTTPDTYFEFDASSPRLDTIIAVDDHSIKIIFLERVDKTSAQKLHHYQLNDNEYPIHAALNISESNVLLEFNEAFIPEEEYEIRVAEVEDLFGNAISTRLKGSFVYDPIAPQLDSLIVRSEHDITLLFHERLFINTATNPQNYLVDNQFAPNSIWHDSELGQKVILSFEKPLLASNDHMLEISNIADIRGNTIQTTIEKPFDNTSFSISEIIVHSSRQIELLFNKKPHPTSGSNIANYVIQEEQINSLSINEHAVILDLTDDLVNQSNYILTVQNVSDKNNQALSIINYSFLFDSKFNSANWLNRKTIELTFDTPIDQDFLVPGLFQINGQVPSYAIVSTENNHIIRLFFNQDFATDETHTLEWQSLTNIYGNKVPGYRIKLIIDTQAPIATSLQVINNHEVQIQFNESLDPTTATFLPYYEVLQFGNPISIHGQEEDTSVLLSFDKNFIDNQPYQLQITDLLDLAGNVLDTTTLAFTYQSPYLPQYGELIVSEIMAEPNEGEPEFIELYNASNQTLELKGLIWKDGTGESYFSTGSIAPKSYLVISQKPLTGNINSGALNSWLTLNNGGETLSIYAGESLVFSTSYTSDWYQQDDTKGHSLEMVDLSNFCGEETNWSASLSENGTPGSVNSNTAQNPDHFGPSIQSIFATSPNTIELLMSEKLIPKPSMVDEITITPELIINSAELVSPQNNKIEITLGQALVSSQAYELSLDILTDCAANMLTSDGRQATFWLPQLGDSLDLLLNEILFNPKTGGVDFVEVYNNSDKYIDLLGWELQSEKGDGSIDSKVIADDHLIIAPQSYLVFTSDIDMLSANYPISKPENFIPMPSFPSYNDDAGIVTLRNNHSNVIDRLSYSEDYHFELLDDVEGVSLERIAFDVPTDDHNSWQSAASTSYYATPGFVNSQFIGASNLIGLLVIEPKTFFPNGNGQDDFTTIRYQLKHPGNMGNILIYDTQGRMVKSLVENQLLAASGSFKWDGAQNSGAMSKLGYYIVYFEIFDSQGNKSLIKETLVLGGQL